MRRRSAAAATAGWSEAPPPAGTIAQPENTAAEAAMRKSFLMSMSLTPLLC
jgi:hypothetical protein